MLPFSTLLCACTSFSGLLQSPDQLSFGIAGAATDRPHAAGYIQHGMHLSPTLDCTSGRMEVSIQGSKGPLHRCMSAKVCCISTNVPKQQYFRAKAPRHDLMSSISGRNACDATVSTLDHPSCQVVSPTAASEYQLQAASGVHGVGPRIPSTADFFNTWSEGLSDTPFTVQVASSDGLVDSKTLSGSRAWLLQGVAYRAIRLEGPVHPRQAAYKDGMLNLRWQASAPLVRSAVHDGGNPHLEMTETNCLAATATSVLQALLVIGRKALLRYRCAGYSMSAVPPHSYRGQQMSGLPGMVRTAAMEADGLVCVTHQFSAWASGMKGCQPRLHLCGRSSGAEAGDPYGSFVDGAVDTVPRMERPSTLQPSIAADRCDVGIYVVTGGTGMIGSLVAQWLIRRSPCEILLLGRSGRSAGNWCTVGDGDKTTVQACGCDVSIVADGGPALSSSAKPGISIMHAGGVLSDASIQNHRVPGLRRVFGPKVTGAVNCHGLTSACAPSTQVLFSSIASLWGSPGQLQYSAANSVLDSLAASWRREGHNAVSINWGAWSGGGMASNDRGPAARMERMGIGMLSPSSGIRALSATLTGYCDANVAVAPIHWPTFLGRMEPRTRALYSSMPEISQHESPQDMETIAEPERLNNPPPEMQSARQANAEERLDVLQEVRDDAALRLSSLYALVL